MEENPIEMKSGDRVEVELRDDHSSKNIITQAHFRLKDPTDWKSIFTSHQRMEMERHRKRYEKLLMNRPDSLLHRSVASQSAYEPEHEDKYRTREKDKEIHKNPMRFNYVPTKVVKRITSVMSEQTEEEDNESKRHTNSNESGDEDNFSIGSKISKKQVTLSNANQDDHKRKRKLSKISRLSKNSKERKSRRSKESKRKVVTEIEQKESQDPSKVKFHFKAVMDILVKDKAMSKAAKDILRRCRLVKFKKTEEQAERDLFELNNKE